jgi:hypothetical protein
MTYKKKLSDLKNIHSIQGKSGNWDYGDNCYMLGLFNGLEMVLSIMEEREPKFKYQKDLEKSQTIREILK